MRLSGALDAAPTDPPSMRRTAGWKPFIAVVAALALVAVALEELAGTDDTAGTQGGTRALAGGAAGISKPETSDRETGDRVAAPSAAPAPTATTNALPALARGAAESALRRPPAEPVAGRADAEAPPQPRTPAQPAPNRSLCSAENEAAGLCNPH